MPAICLIRVITAGDLPDSPLIRAIPQRSLKAHNHPPHHRPARPTRTSRWLLSSAAAYETAHQAQETRSVRLRRPPSFPSVQRELRLLYQPRARALIPTTANSARACLSEPRRVSSRPFDVRVRALLRAAVAWSRSSPPRRCCAHHRPRMLNHRRVVVLLSAVLVVCTSMMQVTAGMTPRRGHRSGLQSKDSARGGRRAPCSVCVKGEGPPYHGGVKGMVLL